MAISLLFPQLSTIHPNLLEIVITTFPRMRACKFSSATSGARPSNTGASIASNAACAGSIGIVNVLMPSPRASASASLTLPPLE